MNSINDMRQAIIIHCWGGNPAYCWYPQTKKELEEIGFNVKIPAMPDTEHPTLQNWLPELQECIEAPTENLFLIGHSAGCITILRYLETLEQGERIGGAVLVAGFTDDLGIPELESFFREPIDYNGVNSACARFVAIHSDNDPYVDLAYGKLLEKRLGAELIVKPGMDHFSGPVDDEASCLSLPDVAESIRKIIA